MAHESIYNIHWERFRHMLVPGLVRKPRLLATLKALFSPHISEYERFRAFAGDAVYRVSHNGSVVSMEDMLNDQFDPVERRIYINNIQRREPLRFFSAEFQREVGFYSQPNQKNGFRWSLEFNADAADFTVYVPNDLKPGAPELLEGFLTRMRGQLDYYKLYAKKYRIVWTN